MDLKKIIIVFLLFAIGFSNFSYIAYGEDYSNDWSKGNRWDRFLVDFYNEASNLADSNVEGLNFFAWLAKNVIADVDNSPATNFFSGRDIGAAGSLCEGSGTPDGHHHASRILVNGEDGAGRNADGSFNARCDYCHRIFPVYGSDVNDAYQQALEDNDLVGAEVSEDGHIWYALDLYFSSDEGLTLSKNKSTDYYSGSFSGNFCYFTDAAKGTSTGPTRVYLKPCKTGFSTIRVSISLYDLTNNSNLKKYAWNVHLDVNDNGVALLKGGSSCSRSGNSSWFFDGKYYFPAEDSSNSVSVYTVINNINTTSINLATVENNTITNVYENTTIINNDNTQFTLPGGDTYDIDNWNFDFSTNTYHLSLLDGDVTIPVTLEFGIDDLNIKFGDLDLSFKYVVEKTTDSSPLPSSTPVPSGRPDWWPDDYDTDDTPMWEKLFQWLDNFKTWLGEKLDALLGKETVINVEPEIVLPDVDPGFVYADEDGSKQIWQPSTLKQKFAFWTDVRDIGTELYSSVQAGGDAPELIIHLGAANSPFGFKYGGDEYAMDLSWYGQYKETVDSITGGFLWLLYLYGVFKHLPEILSGVGMLDNRVEDIQAGTKGRRHKH